MARGGSGAAQIGADRRAGRCSEAAGTKAAMAGYVPGLLPADRSQEKEFVQAYEDVLERYKGTALRGRPAGPGAAPGCPRLPVAGPRCSGSAVVPAAPRPGWASNGPGCRVSRRRCAVSARFCRGRRSPGAARCPPRYRFSVPGSVLLNRGAREGDVTPRCPTCPPTLAGGSVRCRRCVTRPFSAPPHRIAFLSAERRRNRGAPALVRGVPGRLEIPGWG